MEKTLRKAAFMVANAAEVLVVGLESEVVHGKILKLEQTGNNRK